MNGNAEDRAAGSEPSLETIAPLARRGVVQRLTAGVLVAFYFIVLAVLSITGATSSYSVMVAVASMPSLVTAVAGIPRVLRAQPRGLMAIFHLVVYPLFALITIGLPALLLMLAAKEYLPR